MESNFSLKESGKVVLSQWFLTKGDFALQDTCDNVWRHSVTTEGWESPVPGILWAEVTGAAKHPTNRRTAPQSSGPKCQ